jgi:predicted RNA polymerase sigma factor
MSHNAAHAEAHARAQQVARVSYGKLLAILVSKTRDILAAEDALADAFAKALQVWPEQGVPHNPEGWLVAAAKNRHLDVVRSASVRTSVGLEPDVMSEALGIEDAAMAALDTNDIPDRRLQLMFACAHPALDDSVHTPLMLQTVLGVEAKDIANAFLMPQATLAQRLVRAKRKIKDAGLRLTLPDKADAPKRLDKVLQGIYGAYAVDWDRPRTDDATKDLSAESMFLAALVVDLMPDEPEALGLLALLAFSLARRAARTKDGVLVPLDVQDTSLWDARLMHHGEGALARAAKSQTPGRFQLEAAIQSCHCQRRSTGRTDWRMIVQLYDGLMAVSPTLGAAVGQAAAMGHAFGPAVGLRALDEHDASALKDFQPAWATRAHLLLDAGDTAKARAAFARAIDLCTNLPTRAYLKQRLTSIG